MFSASPSLTPHSSHEDYRFLSEEVWTSPWRKSIKGDWVRDMAPTRKERHRKGIQVTLLAAECQDKDVNELKALLRSKHQEGLARLAGEKQ